LRELITVRTKAVSVVLGNEGGNSEISIIRHYIQLGSQLNESAIQNLMLILSIPKNITDSASKVDFSEDYGQKVIKEDPIFSLPITKEVTYRINGRIDTNSASSIAVLLVKKSASVAIPGISGMAVSETRYAIWPFNIIGGKIGSSLFIQVIILVVLLSIYLVYTLQPEVISRPAEALGNRFRSVREKIGQDRAISSELHPPSVNPQVSSAAVQPQQIQHLDALAKDSVIPAGKGVQHSYITYRLQRALQLAEQNNYEEASAAYYELKFLYNTLNSNEKSILYPQIINLGHKLNIVYMRGLIAEAKAKIDSDYNGALESYNKLAAAYSLLPTEFKYAIFAECFELLNLLERKKRSQMAQPTVQPSTFNQSEGVRQKKRGRSKSVRKTRR